MEHFPRPIFGAATKKLRRAAQSHETQSAIAASKMQAVFCVDPALVRVASLASLPVFRDNIGTVR